MRFVLETDARVLVAQLNQIGMDLPGALVTRWIAWIQLFNFEIWHIPGKKHNATDKLSRKPPIAANLVEAEAKTDIDDFILIKLNSPRVSPIFLDKLTFILANSYSDNSLKIATYLMTLHRPLEMTIKKFNAFKKKAIKFKV